MNEEVTFRRGKQKVLENCGVRETHPTVQVVLTGCPVYSENQDIYEGPECTCVF